MIKLLTATGYGGTGSSAVTNILEEFDAIKSFGNEEFPFASYPDGIADLENAFIDGNPIITDLSVKRLLQYFHILSSEDHYKNAFHGKFEEMAIDYINDITQIAWNGWWFHCEDTNYRSKKQKSKHQIISKMYSIFLRNNMLHSSYEPDGWHPTYLYPQKVYYSHLYTQNEKEIFLEKTKIFTDKLLKEAAGNDNKYKYVMLDQAIPPLNFSRFLRYFSSPKVIIVDRDPRDMYVLNKVFWGQYWIPSYDVRLFIEYYSKVRRPQKQIPPPPPISNTDKVLFIQFESLIYEYDNSIKKIMDYTELTENEHINKLKCFNPDLSVENTQVFSEYPDLSADIKLIEKHLGDYCYDFPKIERQIKTNYCLIEDKNNIFNKSVETGNFEPLYKEYFIFYLFKLTKFYTAITELKKRKRLIPFIKMLIKSTIFLFFLPFDLIMIKNIIVSKNELVKS